MNGSVNAGGIGSGYATAGPSQTGQRQKQGQKRGADHDTTDHGTGSRHGPRSAG